MLGRRELTDFVFRLNSLCHFGHIHVSARTIRTNLKATNLAYRLLSRKSLREDMARLRERMEGVVVPLSSKPGVRVVGRFNVTRSAALTVSQSQPLLSLGMRVTPSNMAVPVYVK